MIHAGLRWWWRLVSTNSAKSSSKPPKVAIGDVMSSIKKTETKGGRGSIWSHRTFLGARKSLVHWCACAYAFVNLCLCLLLHTGPQRVCTKCSAQMVRTTPLANWQLPLLILYLHFWVAEGQSCQISAFNHQELFTFDCSHPYPHTNLLPPIPSPLPAYLN